MLIACEVKQVDTSEATADTLAQDAVDAGVSRALLAVLPPGVLVDFDRTSVIRRVEKDWNVVMRIVRGTRELLHEVLVSSDVGPNDLCVALPRLFAEALQDIRASTGTSDAWAALASRWH